MSGLIIQSALQALADHRALVLASIRSGGRAEGAGRTSSGRGGVQNVGYKSLVLAPWGLPGKLGQIRGPVAPAEAGCK